MNMNLNAIIDRLVQEVCVRLGRYGKWSAFLDQIASLICPSFIDPRLLPAVAQDMGPLPRPLFMVGRRSNEGGVNNNNPGPPPAPSPGPGDPGDPPHSTKECAPDRYHGMHGAPCAYHGGSDKMCPYGTMSGLWWRFNIPKIGNVYYVDCCGLPIKWNVWCRWAKEYNWCAGKGNNVYTCTLTILQSELHVGSDNFTDPSYYVPVGPPPPP
jgi:hypothetical protein